MIFAVVPEVVTVTFAVEVAPPVNVVTWVPVLVPPKQLRLVPRVVLDVPVVGPPPVQALTVPTDFSVAAWFVKVSPGLIVEFPA